MRRVHWAPRSANTAQKTHGLAARLAKDLHMPGRITDRSRRLALAAIAAGSLLLAGAPSAGATSASETVSAGSLAFINSTPGNVTFPSTTLNGTDQTATQTQN